MKKLIVAVILIVFGYAANCQFSLQDKLALEIPPQATYSTAEISLYVKSHFSSDSERVRALFVWVSNNINYDIEKMRSKRPEDRPAVGEVLKARKAVCQGYSELFVALCKECNIKAIFVGGYSKLPNGSIADVAHAWVAAEINNKWYLFDPTWAAGSVKDGQFTRTFSNRYYKVLPEEMIKDHMPFDPMYQFLDYPLTYNEFNAGKVFANSKPYFNYKDTIQLYNSMDTLNQVISFARRINRNGEKNSMIYEAIQILQKNQQSGESKMGFEGAVANFNKATDIFNRYIDYKNKRFASVKDDKAIQQMIDSVLLQIKTVNAMLDNVEANTEENRRSIQGFRNAITQLYQRADAENTFLKAYFKTDRSAR